MKQMTVLQTAVSTYVQRLVQAHIVVVPTTISTHLDSLAFRQRTRQDTEFVPPLQSIKGAQGVLENKGLSAEGNNKVV